jgi:putative DNA primase/helicase
MPRDNEPPIWESDPDLKVEADKLRKNKSKPNGQGADEFSDDALALDFTDRHKHELRYVAKWGTWLHWDGARWKFEDTLKVFDLARAVARDFANACDNPGDKPKIASAKTVAAIVSLARSDRRHAATVDIWDTDHWLLNTPGGIVDLKTGTLLPHDPTTYITKVSAVAPSDDCPLWRTFLDEITGRDHELQAFLQRIAGYALTGSIREHALFFFHGTGGNGKGVFLNTLTAILADYAAVAPMETFVATQNEQHPTDLAGLRGARLVTSQETEKGRRWAESKIKALTGGDPITARFIRQDFFTYSPAFKLVIAGNHKPSLGSVDEAIRRRLNLVPFTVTIAEPDEDLPDKLRAEWPGILAWMIEGCLRWQEKGLNPPEAVKAATTTYLSEEDSLGQWAEECCVTGKEQWGVFARLWASWKEWAETSKEPVGTRKAFAGAMAAHGYAPGRRQRVRGYTGIDLKHDERSRPYHG